MSDIVTTSNMTEDFFEYVGMKDINNIQVNVTVEDGQQVWHYPEKIIAIYHHQELTFLGTMEQYKKSKYSQDNQNNFVFLNLKIQENRTKLDQMVQSTHTIRMGKFLQQLHQEFPDIEQEELEGLVGLSSKIVNSSINHLNNVSAVVRMKMLYTTFKCLVGEYL